MDTDTAASPLTLGAETGAPPAHQGQLSDVEQNMLNAGVTIDEPGFEDYFGFNETRRWYFPDGKQYIEYRLMNEGSRSNFQSKNSRDVRLFKASGDASIKVDPSVERWILFQESVIGWFVVKKNPDTGDWDAQPFDRNGKPAPGGAFEQWAKSANPKLISDLEAAIRKANPWLQTDLSVKDIDEQIKELQEMRIEAVRREEGK